MFMPFQVLGMWLRPIVSLVILGVGIFLLYKSYDHYRDGRAEGVAIVRDATIDDPDLVQPTNHDGNRSWQFGLNRETAYLLGGLSLVLWSLGGGMVVGPYFWRRRGKEEPRVENGHKSERLVRPDGSELCVTSYGPQNADPVVFLHGWGLDSNEWFYTKRQLGNYRLIVWDLPGLGRSTRPANRDWSLEKLARDLDAVIATAGDKPVVLVGHSIGTMIILTYCKLFPESLGRRVRGLVLAQSTYTNPVRTTSKAWFYTAMQKPLLEPLCHLMVWLSPLMRVMNWMSYVNGSAHRSTERSSFSGQETRGQLDFLTRYYVKSPPDVIGRGMLGMFRYDATHVLETISVPTLVIAGDRDSTCTPEASRYMADHIPDAELVTLASSKHCGLFEHYEQFHEALVSFLADIPAAATVPESEKTVPRTVRSS
jgi:pimeloyl-ACP methyl ester carboxylesterase